CGVASQFVRRVSLTPAGDRVQGSISTATFDVTGASNEEPKDLGLMPDGRRVLVVDTNDGNTASGLVTLDPAPTPITLSSFATMQPGNNVEGAFSRRIGRMILDNGLTLRAYLEGGTTATSNLLCEMRTLIGLGIIEIGSATPLAVGERPAS